MGVITVADDVNRHPPLDKVERRPQPELIPARLRRLRNLIRS